MKIEIDEAIVNDFREAMFIELLMQDYSLIKGNLNSYTHPDDVKYDRKLLKAYKKILNYYGESVDEID